MSGTFPILTEREIVECLIQMGLSITLADLQEPKARTMSSLFQSFVDQLMGVSKEDASQPLHVAVDVLEYSELHENSIGEIMIVKKL
jgi:hypothetical protein